MEHGSEEPPAVGGFEHLDKLCIGGRGDRSSDADLSSLPGGPSLL